MPDYRKLAAYLSAHPGVQVTLSFDEVETLLGESLPLAARVLSG